MIFQHFLCGSLSFYKPKLFFCWKMIFVYNDHKNFSKNFSICLFGSQFLKSICGTLELIDYDFIKSFMKAF